MELYLVTGFLGAGKTTFLKRLIGLLEGKRIHLIINEFGQAGVDGALLSELGATLAEINNGSIFCACRLDQFERALEQAVEQQPEVVLVEASGLADPTNVRAVLRDVRFADICYRGAICLVDAMRFERVLSTSRVCPKQLAVSSVVLLNKTDLAPPEQIARVKEQIHERNPAAMVYETRFGECCAAWLKQLKPDAVLSEAEYGAELTLQKALVGLSPDMTTEQLRHFLRMLVEDTYRIKGFVRLEGAVLLVDCVGPMVEMNPATVAGNGEENRLVLLAGRGMPLRKSLKNACEWYKGLAWEIK